MDPSFDANKMTSDLKQILRLPKSTTESDVDPTQNISSSHNVSRNSNDNHSNGTSKSKNVEMGVKTAAPASTDNSKKMSSNSDVQAPLSKSGVEKVRKKKHESEKQGRKGSGKSSSSIPNDTSSTPSDTKSSKALSADTNSSAGKISPLIVLPSKSQNIGYSDNSVNKVAGCTNTKQEAQQSNDNNNAAKNKYDDLTREMQIKLDRNKIFFLKNKKTRFPNAKYFCRYCDFHMDTIEICENHMEDAKHCHRKEVGSMDSTLQRIPPPTENHIEAVTESINLLYDEYAIKPTDRDLRRAIVQRLETFVQKDIPDVVLHMYGSSLTCMGLKTSDINVNLTSTMKDKKLTTLLKDLYSLLKDCTDNGFNNVHSDFSATVPVLLMTDIETGYQLSITIHVYTSLCTSELLSIYSDFDERTIKLAVALRYWAYLSGVDRHSAGFMPPIAFNVMVIFFLQAVKPSVLPIVGPPGVCGEEANDFSKDKTIFQLKRNKVMSRKSELTNDMSVGELWVRLLRFYAMELEIPDVVISIRTANPVSRRHKPWNSRKLAVEEPYMLKNLTRMPNRCYDYWQYIIMKSYHYFGLPRGPGGVSHLPEFDLPNEEENVNALPYEQSEKGDRNTADKGEENGTENDAVIDSRLESSSRPDRDTTDIKEDTDLVPKFEYHNNALHSSASKLAHVSSESQNISSRDSVKTSSDTSSAIPNSLQLESQPSIKSSSPVDGDDVNSKIPVSPQSFTSDTEKTHDLVTPRISASQPSSSSRPLPLPSSQIEEPKQSDTDTAAGPEVISSKEKTDSEDETSPFPRKDCNKCIYEFHKDYFTDKKEPAMVCVICEKEGHHKNECPEDVLPEVLPIQGFTKQHHQVLEEALKKMPLEVGLSDVSFAERRNFLHCLQDFIQVGFPGARLHLFGSSCNGFGFDRSDMDICMTFVKKRPNIDKVFAVERLANILMVHKDLKNVQAIPTAKVPIVKFTIKSADLDGDISLYNTLAQENTRLLYCYSQIDRRVQILGYTIKMFAQVCDIGDASRGSLSSYGYILMMLYYLQQVQPPVIPVLQQLYTSPEKPKKFVEGCDAWFMSDMAQLPKLWSEMGKNKMSVAELWLGFLRFYVEEFNPRELVICIRQKEPLTRFDKLWNGFCLAIEDPFDLNHNLGSGLTRTMNNFILKTLINGRMLYGSPIDDNMELFNKYQTPSDYFFDTELLSEARPTTSRGCRCCGKIGHMVRHCPVSREQKKRKEQENAQSEHEQPPNSSHEKDQQSRQHNPQNHRSQGHPSEHHEYSMRNTPEMQGHPSSRRDQHSSPRQGKPPPHHHRQQQQPSFQPQDVQKLQKRIERDLFGNKYRGSDPRQDNVPMGGQGHHYNMGGTPASAPICVPLAICSGQPNTFLQSQTSYKAQSTVCLTSNMYNNPVLFGPQMNRMNPPFMRPPTVSPAMNPRHPVRSNAPRHQFPQSMRPRQEHGNQYPMYRMTPPQGPPFHHMNYNNHSHHPPSSSSGGGSANGGNNNAMMNAAHKAGGPGPFSHHQQMPPPPGYNMGMPPPPPHGSVAHAPPPLLPHPTGSRGMSPVVQNLFASTQGKVVRMMQQPNVRK